MFNKKVFIFIIFIIIITLYGILKGNYYFFEEDSKVVIEKISSEPVNINKDIETKAQHNSTFDNSNKFVNSSIYIQQKTFNVCGKSFSSLKNKLTYTTNKKNIELTDKQLEAQDKILKECLEWFDYLDSLDNKNKHQITVDKINTLKVVKYYLKNKMDSNTLSEARLTMDTGGDASAYSYMALNYLILHDDELVSTIAERLGTNDIDYIRNSNINLVELYTCSIVPESCYSDSIRVLNLCLTYNWSCDIPLQQYIASKVSSNQYNDLMNMVDIIKMLIRQGYFS